MQCFPTKPRVFSGFLCVDRPRLLARVCRLDLGCQECKKGKTVTIRGKLNGTNTGTSAPLTAPFFRRFYGTSPVRETGALQSDSTRPASRFRVVPGQIFHRLLDAWFGNASRVLQPWRGFNIWGGVREMRQLPTVPAGARTVFQPGNHQGTRCARF